MDATLTQYSTRIAEIKQSISYVSTILPAFANIENYLVELTIMQQYLEDTLSQIKELNTELMQRKSIKNTIVQSPNIINSKLYTDDAVLNYDLFLRSTNKIIPVNNIHDIPETPLYYISGLNQYAINIGGMLLRGNIGNIYNICKIANNPTDITNLVYCKHKNQCKRLLSGLFCKYYHDPAELQQLKDSGMISATTYKSQNKPRNFSNTSWIYTEYPENSSNENMRHFGSRDTLRQYIQLAKIQKNSRTVQYKKNYADQCMHDILVLFSMHSNEV
jgi:hypothetical protein